MALGWRRQRATNQIGFADWGLSLRHEALPRRSSFHALLSR
jgi:hypothetical protein